MARIDENEIQPQWEGNPVVPTTGLDMKPRCDHIHVFKFQPKLDRSANQTAVRSAAGRTAHLMSAEQPGLPNMLPRTPEIANLTSDRPPDYEGTDTCSARRSHPMALHPSQCFCDGSHKESSDLP